MATSNRAVPDAEFVGFRHAFAERVSRFDLLALADIKRFVNAASLAAAALTPKMDAFAEAIGRPPRPPSSGRRRGRLPAAQRRRTEPGRLCSKVAASRARHYQVMLGVTRLRVGPSAGSSSQSDSLNQRSGTHEQA